MRRLIVLVAGLVLSCGQANPPSAVTPVTSSPGSTTASPLVSTTTPPPLLSCRLPIRNALGRGARLDLTAGSVIVDDQSPTADQLFYSRSAKRWLPVGRDAVSSDGLQYAFVDGRGAAGQLHVVDVASGKESRFPMPAAGPLGNYNVLDFTPPLVTLTAFGSLKQVDLRTGAVTTPVFAEPVWRIDGNIAWGQLVNPADPHPVGGFTGQPDEVDRLTIGGGKEIWLYRESTSISVVGLDGHGTPIVLSYKDPTGGIGDLLLLTAPNITRTVFTGSQTNAYELRPKAIDSHGVWFAGRDGIYLLPDGGSLMKVSDVLATPAGGCE